MKLSRTARSVHIHTKRRQLYYENLETRLPFALGGLASADPTYVEDPDAYASFPNVNLPKLHSNGAAGAVLYLWFEGGIQENGIYFPPSDNELKGSSTDSETLSTGSKTIRTQSGLSFAPGNRVHIHDKAMTGPVFNGSPTESTKFMNGIVTSYTTVPGNPLLADLVVNVDSVNGSGTIADWSITNTTFNDEERENILEIWRQTSKSFAIFNVDVTTDWVDLATKPNSMAGVRNLWDGGSVEPGALFGAGPNLFNVNATDVQRFAGWVEAHEFGHTLNLTHQANYNSVGLVTAEYGLTPDPYSFFMMGNRSDTNANPHMMKWSIGQPDNSVSSIQDDIGTIAARLTAVGVSPFRTTEPDFVADYGNTAGTAATLTDIGGGDYGRAGTIYSLSDVDFFTFTTPSDGVYDIMVGHDVYGADFTLQVESATATIAAEDGDTTVSSVTRNVYDQHVSIFLPAGTYKVRVGSHGNYGDVGPYVVRASRIGNASLPWRAEDVGFVGVPGYSQVTNSTTYTVTGSGANFGRDNNILNGYQFLSQRLQGDGEIVARVSGLNGANEWSLGGLMIRSNVEGNDSKYVSLVMTEGHGYMRFADDGAASRKGVLTESGPITPFAARYLKITRAGDLFKFYTSTNGTSYTEIPNSDVTITMPSDTFIGLVSAGVGDSNVFMATANNGLQNQRLTVTDFTNVALVGNLNPAAFGSINTFTPATIGSSPTSTNTSVSISWNNVAGQTESGYTVERSEDGVNWTNLTPTTPLSASTFSYTDSSAGLHDSERYWYRVRSHKSDGTVSNPSSPVIIATKPNAVATLQTFTATSTSVTLRWNDVDGETGYKVYRSGSLNGMYSAIPGTLPANATTFTNTGLSAGTKYYYKIETLGPSSWAIQNTTGVAVDTRWTDTAVATPGAGSVTSTATSITIDWANFTTPAGVASYRVYRGQAAAHTSNFTVLPVGTPTSSIFTDTGLTMNAWYVYRIYAVNASGFISAPTAEIWKQAVVSFARMSSGSSGGSSSSSLATSDLVMVNAPTSPKQADVKSSSAANSVAPKNSSSALQNAALNQVAQELCAKLPDSLVSLLATTKKEKRSNATNIFGELGSESPFSF